MQNNKQRLIEGEVMEPADDSEVDRLRDELRRVSGELDTLRKENIRLRQRVNQVDGPVMQIRQTLEPLHQALRALFGEIEVIDPQVAAPSQAHAQSESGPSSDPRASVIWDSWKKKLGPQCAKIIDVLLVHADMNTTQLGIAIQTNRRNIPGLIYRMNQAGLINKNGGRFSLKQLT